MSAVNNSVIEPLAVKPCREIVSATQKSKPPLKPVYNVNKPRNRVSDNQKVFFVMFLTCFLKKCSKRLKLYDFEFVALYRRRNQLIHATNGRVLAFYRDVKLKLTDPRVKILRQG